MLFFTTLFQFLIFNWQTFSPAEEPISTTICKIPRRRLNQQTRPERCARERIMVQVILLNLFKQQFTSETNLSLSTLLNEFTTHAEPERERTRGPVLRKSQMAKHHQRVKLNLKVSVWHRELHKPSNQLKRTVGYL